MIHREKAGIRLFKIPPLFEVRFVASAGGCERLHTHASLVVSAVRGGAIRLRVGDERFDLRVGMLAAVGPHVLHAAESFSPDFAGVYVLELFAFPQGFAAYDDACLSGFGRLILQDEHAFNDFVALCERLLQEGRQAEKLAALGEWLDGLLTRRFGELSGAAGSDSESDRLALKIKGMLDGEDAEKPAYDRIADACGFSPEHCNRVFRQRYRLSMQAYFLNRKAARARSMLDSGAPLAEVALRCGFYDQSHFSRVFRAIYQVSPRQYREAMGAVDQSRTRSRSPAAG